MPERKSNAMDVLNTSISYITENIDRYRKQAAGLHPQKQAAV